MSQLTATASFATPLSLTSKCHLDWRPQRESPGSGTLGVAVLGQGRSTQSQPARSQPPCLVPSRLIPIINKHIVLVHVNRLHAGGELSLRGALLHIGIDSAPSTSRVKWFSTTISRRRCSAGSVFWLGALWIFQAFRDEGTKQGGWERTGCDWVKRPCPNTATSRVPIPEDSLLDVACHGPP